MRRGTKIQAPIPFKLSAFQSTLSGTGEEVMLIPLRIAKPDIYQRHGGPGPEDEPDARMIKRYSKISKKWDDRLAVTPTISLRLPKGETLSIVNGVPNAGFYVLDGMTHIKAEIIACERKGEMNPHRICRILRGLSLKEEAKIARELRESVSPFTMDQAFQQRLVGGDPSAIEIKKVCDELGITIAKDRGGLSISCYKGLEFCRLRKNLKLVLGILKDMATRTVTGKLELSWFNRPNVQGFSHFLWANPSVDPERLIKKLRESKEAVPKELPRAFESAKEPGEKDTGRAECRILGDIYNKDFKGRSRHRLNINIVSRDAFKY